MHSRSKALKKVRVYRFTELLQNLQVEFKEEAESQRTTKLNLPARNRWREVQLLQEDVVCLVQGPLIPWPDKNPNR